MHRYREFGLVSDQDETLRRAFRDGFKRVGLSFPQFLDALAWYRDHAGAANDEAGLVDAFAAFAAHQGWTPAHRDGAIGIYQAIRDGGAQAVTAEAPHPDADRATIARADDLMRRDPARYWHDAELQDAVFEARERLAHGTEATAPTPRGAAADRQKVAEVEALLHDPGGAGQRRYWNDAGLRAEYAQALSRLHGDAPATADDTPSGQVVAAPPESVPAPQSAADVNS